MKKERKKKKNKKYIRLVLEGTFILSEFYLISDLEFVLSKFYLIRTLSLSITMGLDFLRPVLEEAQPLNITFGITLQQIIDVVSCPKQIKDTFNKLILPRLIKPLNTNTNSNKNTNTSTNTNTKIQIIYMVSCPQQIKDNLNKLILPSHFHPG